MIKDYLYNALVDIEGQKVTGSAVFESHQDCCTSFRLDFGDGDSLEFEAGTDGHNIWIDVTKMRLKG